jgi:hypothetical protein
VQPLLYQAGDARVGNAVLDEFDQPFVLDGVEGNHDTLPLSTTFPKPSSLPAQTTLSKAVVCRLSAASNALVDCTFC